MHSWRYMLLATATAMYLLFGWLQVSAAVMSLLPGESLRPLPEPLVTLLAYVIIPALALAIPLVAAAHAGTVDVSPRQASARSCGGASNKGFDPTAVK